MNIKGGMGRFSFILPTIKKIEECIEGSGVFLSYSKYSINLKFYFITPQKDEIDLIEKSIKKAFKYIKKQYISPFENKKIRPGDERSVVVPLKYVKILRRDGKKVVKYLKKDFELDKLNNIKQSSWKDKDIYFLDCETYIKINNIEEYKNAPKELRSTILKKYKSLPFIYTWAGKEDFENCLNIFLKENNLSDLKDLNDIQKKDLISRLFNFVKISESLDDSHNNLFIDTYDKALQAKHDLIYIAHNAAYDFTYFEKSLKLNRDINSRAILYYKRGGCLLEAGINCCFNKSSGKCKLRINFLDTFLFARHSLTDEKIEVPYGLSNLVILNGIMKYTDINTLEEKYFSYFKYVEYAKFDIVYLFLLYKGIISQQQDLINFVGLSNFLKPSLNRTCSSLGYKIIRFLAAVGHLHDFKNIVPKNKLLQVENLVSRCGGVSIQNTFKPLISTYSKDFINEFGNSLYSAYSSLHKSCCGGFTFHNNTKDYWESDKNSVIRSYDINSSYPYIMQELPGGEPHKAPLKEWGDDYFVAYIVDSFLLPEWKDKFKFIGRDCFIGNFVDLAAQGCLLLWKNYYDQISLMVENPPKIRSVWYFKKFDVYKKSMNNLLKIRRDYGKKSKEGKLVKILMNSQYGKLLQREFFDDIVYQDGDIIELDKDLKDYKSPICGGFITQLGQCSLLSAIYKYTNLNIPVICGDTDSLKILCPKNFKKHPINISDELGDWKHEGNFSKFYYQTHIRKKYCGEPLNEGNLNLALSGWSSDLIDQIKNVYKKDKDSATSLTRFIFANNILFLNGKTRSFLNNEGNKIILNEDVAFDGDEKPNYFLELINKKIIIKDLANRVVAIY